MVNPFTGMRFRWLHETGSDLPVIIPPGIQFIGQNAAFGGGFNALLFTSDNQDEGFYRVTYQLICNSSDIGKGVTTTLTWVDNGGNSHNLTLNNLSLSVSGNTAEGVVIMSRVQPQQQIFVHFSESLASSASFDAKFVVERLGLNGDFGNTQ